MQKIPMVCHTGLEPQTSRQGPRQVTLAIHTCGPRLGQITAPTTDADKALFEERKKLAAEYTEYSRPPVGGGPSKAPAIAY